MEGKRHSSSSFDLYAYKKNRPGLSRIYPGQAGFCLDPDRSHAQVGRVPDQPAGPVRVSKL